MNTRIHRKEKPPEYMANSELTEEEAEEERRRIAEITRRAKRPCFEVEARICSLTTAVEMSWPAGHSTNPLSKVPEGKW